MVCSGGSRSASSPRGRNTVHARLLASAALAARDTLSAAEILTRPEAGEHPSIQVALAGVRREEVVVCLWRGLAGAVAVPGSCGAQLVAKCNELSSQQHVLPPALEAALEALRGEERARRAEDEYQLRLRERARGAADAADADALRALIAEARLLGEDPSAAEAAMECMSRGAATHASRTCSKASCASVPPRPGSASSGARAPPGHAPVGEEAASWRRANMRQSPGAGPPASATPSPPAATLAAPPLLPSARRSRSCDAPAVSAAPPPRPTSASTAGGHSRAANAAAAPPPAAPGRARERPASAGPGGLALGSLLGGLFHRAMSPGPGCARAESRPEPRPEPQTEQRATSPSSRPSRGASALGGSRVTAASTPSSAPAASASAAPAATAAAAPRARPRTSQRETPTAAPTANKVFPGTPFRARDPAADSPRGVPGAGSAAAAAAERGTPRHRPWSALSSGAPPPGAAPPSTGSASGWGVGATPGGGAAERGSPGRGAAPGASAREPTWPPPRPAPWAAPRPAAAAASPRRRSPRQEEGRSQAEDLREGCRRPSFAPPRAPSAPPQAREPPRVSVQSSPPRSAGAGCAGGPGGGERLPSARCGRALTRLSALARLDLQSGSEPTVEEIRRAYKQAALRWHPDRQQNHDCADEAKRCFQEMREAFDYLQRAPNARLGGC